MRTRGAVDIPDDGAGYLKDSDRPAVVADRVRVII